MLNEIKIYYREIIATGHVDEMFFDESHDREAHEINHNLPVYGSRNMSRLGALELVNKWNHSSKYRYRIN